jgi:uncharacterized RDD family membrane protein YckC
MVTAKELETCKKCANQRLDANGEIICRLTNKEPDFRGPCIFYESVPGSESFFEEFESEVYLQSAGNWKRLANYIVELIFMYIISASALYVFGLVLKTDDMTNYLGDNRLVSLLLTYVVRVVWYVTYYSMIEYFTGGRSIGKYMTGTKVITLDGDKPDFKTCLIRSLCRYIPFEVFSFFGSTDAGWHDSMSKTRVVIINPTI